MAKVVYTGDTWEEWFLFTNDISKLWIAQPTYLISQAVFLAAGIITFIHALSKGGRWPYFWLGTILHGIHADNFWHFVLPDYDNFWHSQAPIMLMGARLPLHIIFLYPAFMYHAAYAVSKLNLPKYAEPFAAGLLVVLIDIPYDIVAVKFVHWTWHDTDPNIYDRHYSVPWNSYYFHSTFMASFYYFFVHIRTYFDANTQQWQSSSKIIEWAAVVIAVFLGMPGGVVLFVFIYHPLHDMFHIHSEVTFFMLLSIYMVVIIHGLLDRTRKTNPRLQFMDYLLLAQLSVHYLIYLGFVIFFDPENEISTGLHEPVGSCNEIATFVTPFMQTLVKRKYFCPSDYNEEYFDFHCVGDKKPRNGALWYTICGTPFLNRGEYIVILLTIVVAAAGIFHGIYFTCVPNQKKLKEPRETLLKKIKPKIH